MGPLAITAWPPAYTRRHRAAVELATDVEGLRLVLASTVGARYRIRVADDGSVVGLWRR